MIENPQAELRMRISNLEQEVRDLRKILEDMVRPRPQRDISSSPAPQRDTTTYRRPSLEYRTEPDENPFAQPDEPGFGSRS